MAFITSTAYRQNTSFAAILKALAADILTTISEIRKRQSINATMASLSDEKLRDIGLTRNDVESSTQLPLSFSSAQELYRTKRTRVGNW